MALAFPKPPILAQGVLDRAIRVDSAAAGSRYPHFSDEQQVAGAGVLADHLLERPAEAAFVARAAIADNLVNFGLVLMDELN